MIKKIFCLTILIFTFSFNSWCQIDSSGKTFYKYCDTVSFKKFDKLVKYYLKKMEISASVSVPEIIEMIKIYNSDPKNRNLRYKKFLALYQKTYMGRACDMLNCISLKGLVLYSKEYNLYLSSTKDVMPCYNYFFIK